MVPEEEVAVVPPGAVVVLGAETAGLAAVGPQGVFGAGGKRKCTAKLNVVVLGSTF